MESSRTHFEVLGLVASSPRKLPCPRFEDSTICWIVKILFFARKKIWHFLEIAWKKFLKNFFFVFGERLKDFLEDRFFGNTWACVLGLWPWPRAFLSLASRGSVLGRAVEDSDFFVWLALASSLVFSTPPLMVTFKLSSNTCFNPKCSLFYHHYFR